MDTQKLMQEYRAEVRERVCSHCIERPQGGPPCDVRGKPCGIEMHLEEIVALAHGISSSSMDPYVTGLHEGVCAECVLRTSRHCPCPLDYLLPLVVEAIEEVDSRHAECAGV